MKKISIQIPDEIYSELEQVFEQSGLTSFEDFLLSLIQQALDQIRNESDGNIDEEEEIRKRLENLGYM